MRLDRRSFLSVLGGATLAWPRTVEALAQQLAPGGGPTDESFWGLVRAQFLIPPDRIYLNNGTLGPSPYVVVDAVTEHTRRVAMTYPPGVAWLVPGFFLPYSPVCSVNPLNMASFVCVLTHQSYLRSQRIQAIDQLQPHTRSLCQKSRCPLFCPYLCGPLRSLRPLRFNSHAHWPNASGVCLDA